VIVLSGVKLAVQQQFFDHANKKRLLQWKQPHSKLPVRLPLVYCRVVVSVGLGVVVVVSIGVVVVVVSVGIVAAVSVVMGGDDVSEPVEFSGVSQPNVAIAKKAMKRMLFMRFTLS
jgi:hypothetical protein